MAGKMTQEVKDRLRLRKAAGRERATLAAVPPHWWLASIDEWMDGRASPAEQLIRPDGSVAAADFHRKPLGLPAWSNHLAQWVRIVYAPAEKLAELSSPGRVATRPVLIQSYNFACQVTTWQPATVYRAADIYRLFGVIWWNGPAGREDFLRIVRTNLRPVTAEYTNRYPGVGARFRVMTPLFGGEADAVVPGDVVRVDAVEAMPEYAAGVQMSLSGPFGPLAGPVRSFQAVPRDLAWVDG